MPRHLIKDCKVRTNLRLEYECHHESGFSALTVHRRFGVSIFDCVCSEPKTRIART